MGAQENRPNKMVLGGMAEIILCGSAFFWRMDFLFTDLFCGGDNRYF